MRKHLILILITFFYVSVLYAQNLTVASYNIRYENQGDADKGNGWKQRGPVINQLILFHDFDIFGAQEVLHGQLNDMLAQLPGYASIGVGRSDGKNEGEFAPIFYKKDKFKLLQSGHFWLSEIEDKPNVGWDAALPRICTWGKFKMNDKGKTFWFFNLHFDHRGVNARLESSKLVIRKIKTMCGNDPVILTGDFNVDQSSEGYKILNSSDQLSDSYELAEIRYALNGTANAFNPNLKTESRIDHIFVSKNFKVERYGVLTDSYRSPAGNSSEEVKSGNFPKELTLHQYDIRLPSDHYPVVVKLKFE